MKLKKIIFTSSEKIKNELLKINIFDEKYDSLDFIVFEWYRNLFKDEEDLVLIFYRNFSKALVYLSENYDPFKVVFAENTTITWNFDLNFGDVIIPNTFISKNTNKPIFIEYVTWENYDLTKFWLVLSWICLSWEPEEEDVYDVRLDNLYTNLLEVLSLNLIDKTVVVIGIDDEEVENNTTSVIELIL